MGRTERRGPRGRGPSGPRGRSSYGRRSPPPDATGAEAEYLLRNKKARTRLVFKLIDGEMVCGVIVYYDRHMIEVERPDSPNVVIRKSEIRYIHEARD